MSAQNLDGSASAVLRPGTVLQDRYRIGRQLGKGGMGAVYEAIDLRLGSTVALKQTLTEAKPLWTQFAREVGRVSRSTQTFGPNR